MSSFALKSDPAHLSLSWESTCQLLQDVKQPHTRQRALDLLLQAHADDIAAMCRSTAWARQWGFEDAYQEAVTHFFETALRTDDPAELTSYWNLRNAVRTGAARNLYPISVTPHFAQKLQSYSFFRELEFVSTSHFSAPDFDEYGWQFLQALCQPFLTKRQQSILTFLCQIPGEVPTILELADYLELSKASAQRAWNYFQRAFKINSDLVQLLHRFIDFDFLQTYFPKLTLSLEQCQQDQDSKIRFKQFLKFRSPLRYFALQCAQPLVDFNGLLSSWLPFDSGLGFQTIYSRLSKGKFSFQKLNINNLLKELSCEHEHGFHLSLIRIVTSLQAKLSLPNFPNLLPCFFRKASSIFYSFNLLDNFIYSLFCSPDWCPHRGFLFINLYRQFLIHLQTLSRRARGSPFCWITSF
ncbi:hypothetical protein [Picosynechococcus sp. PCC 7117]|uniref:hypothetical protein n=1 Tax=Picosynechococcus sp. PCC 7117 TaxID=195498 RepID=UPI0008108A10|nr:hypothetical protein [Picosynechococcus sp. PCC 7117]ANV89087.1 hypothetical protein AWQ22_15975 [Picosynechococcus sp. PCC 7117]